MTTNQRITWDMIKDAHERGVRDATRSDATPEQLRLRAYDALIERYGSGIATNAHELLSQRAERCAMSAPWPTPVPNRYLVQVRNVHDEWISIAGNLTRQPITDAYLGGSGVARRESYRVFDIVAQRAIAQGAR